jgi:hypothetical protein
LPHRRRRDADWTFDRLPVDVRHEAEIDISARVGAVAFNCCRRSHGNPPLEDRVSPRIETLRAHLGGEPAAEAANRVPWMHLNLDASRRRRRGARRFYAVLELEECVQEFDHRRPILGGQLKIPVCESIVSGDGECDAFASNEEPEADAADPNHDPEGSKVGGVRFVVCVQRGDAQGEEDQSDKEPRGRKPPGPHAADINISNEGRPDDPATRKDAPLTEPPGVDDPQVREEEAIANFWHGREDCAAAGSKDLFAGKEAQAQQVFVQ